MGSRDWNVSMVDIHLQKLLWVYCPHAELKGNDRADRLAGKATITSGLLLGRYEVLRSLRHYLRAQSQWHYTIDRIGERDVERGSARRYSLKGRERAIVKSDEQRNRFKGDIRETSQRQGGANMGFSELIDTILNWTEQRYIAACCSQRSYNKGMGRHGVQNWPNCHLGWKLDIGWFLFL